MKLRKLSISEYRHLQNLELDFTYQSGERAGDTLDKICLIGQSATGKTSILEYIKELSLKSVPNLLSNFTDFEIGRLIYFNTEIVSTNNLKKLSEGLTVEGNIRQVVGVQINKTQTVNEEKFRKLLSEKTLEIGAGNNDLFWDYVFSGIVDYRKKVTQKGSELIHKGFHVNYQKMAKEMDDWKKNNPNPLDELARNCLNPILKNLNLEVDVVDTSTPVPLKAINSEKAIPVNALSTGTKQLMLNAIPLYKLDTTDSIIMIDEPERSLFPDIQIQLVDYYRNLAPNAQLIMATHSPFIAAAFEEDERFILYFDNDGKVAVKRGTAPIGDDPNDILKSDFGLENLMNKHGVEAYQKYLGLKQKMHSEKNPENKKKLLLELTAIGDNYKF